MTSSRSARRARRQARPAPVTPLRTASYDASAIEFAGANDIGVMSDVAEMSPPAGYAATTGPIPALGRPAVSIGDALTRDGHWGPKLATLPCGHCGATPPIPAGILERTRIIGHVNWLARQDGWKYDTDLILTCPACQQRDEWKARQGQLELHRGDEPCDRHDLISWDTFPEDDYRCTCPGAVVAVDVMLASEDHLGSGRGRHRAGAR